MKQEGEKFIELLSIIKRLRAPDGCPWDQKQTPRSFKPYMLEEAHELAEAIDNNDPENIKEELGDLFFQAAFINQLYSEEGQFSMTDVLQGIIDKMIRRHPHVFEDKKFSSSQEMRKNWLKVKAREGKKEKSEFDFPRSLSALTRAQRVTERMKRNGFSLPGPETLRKELAEKSKRLTRLGMEGDQQETAQLMGELLLIVVSLGRINGIDCEEELNRQTAALVSTYGKG